MAFPSTNSGASLVLTPPDSAAVSVSFTREISLIETQLASDELSKINPLLHQLFRTYSMATTHLLSCGVTLEAVAELPIFIRETILSQGFNYDPFEMSWGEFVKNAASSRV